MTFDIDKMKPGSFKGSFNMLKLYFYIQMRWVKRYSMSDMLTLPAINIVLQATFS